MNWKHLIQSIANGRGYEIRKLPQKRVQPNESLANTLNIDRDILARIRGHVSANPYEAVPLNELASADKWYLPECDDSKWRNMNVGFYGAWLSGPYMGVGLYRTRYTLPEDMRKKHVYLHFGAADELATVYVDGKKEIEHSTGSMKVSARIVRTLPFSFECPALADGQPHTIAVHVFNLHGLGGLYEPVSVVASDEPLDEDQLWMATEPIRQARVRL